MAMKNRILSLILVFALVFALSLSAAADNSGLCFTATNDTLLDLGSMASSVGGTYYVPCKVFSAFGVYMNYFEADSTALLFNNNNKQIYFDMTSGNSYDADKNYYSVSAIFRNGQVYAPVYWVCNYFGLSCSVSVISGVGYGDIVRIKNGAQVLTDSQFLDAATSLMRSRYNDYYGVTPTASPSPSQPKPGDGAQSTASVALCVMGLPSQSLMGTLDDYGDKACFFVTEEEVLNAPDMIRRICASGNSIGIHCKADPDSEIQQTADVIFDAAQARAVLIASPAAISEACVQYAKVSGFAYYKQGLSFADNFIYDGKLASKFDDEKGFFTAGFIAGDNLDKYMPYILQHLADTQIAALPLLETYV